MKYSIGVGITSACSFKCNHCYSGAGRSPVHLPPDRLFGFIDSFPVGAINLGTGESCMHPEFLQVVNGILERGIPLAITSAGPSLEAMPDWMLSELHDVDLSLDFPTKELHDRARAPGAFRMVVDGLERCRRLGVTVSLAVCLMKANAEHIGALCRFAREKRIPVRINVYKPVYEPALSPSYDEFWNAFSVFFNETDVVACSEPVLNAALAYHGHAHDGSGSPCGLGSFRIAPSGDVLPCVYWCPTGISMEMILEEPELLARCGSQCHGLEAPTKCSGCPWLNTCRGGCSGRRLYTGLTKPDIYCFYMRGEAPPVLKPAEPGGERFIHSSYLCTVIGQPLA